MRNRQGINTSAVFGFTKFLRDILMKEAPRYMGVAFDPKGGTFRNELYPQYKANRNETPEDIVTAVPTSNASSKRCAFPASRSPATKPTT